MRQHDGERPAAVQRPAVARLPGVLTVPLHEMIHHVVTGATATAAVAAIAGSPGQVQAQRVQRGLERLAAGDRIAGDLLERGAFDQAAGLVAALAGFVPAGCLVHPKTIA